MKYLLIVYLHNDMPTNVKRQMLRFRDNGNFDVWQVSVSYNFLLLFNFMKELMGSWISLLFPNTR